MATPSKTPRQQLRDAKARFVKAQETFAKAQETWQQERRKFTDTLTHGAPATDETVEESEESTNG